MIPFLFIVGALAGGMLLLPLVILRNLYRVDEVVTTLFLNFVVVLLVSYLLEGPMKDPMGLGWPQGRSVIDEGVLPQLIPRTRLHMGFMISVFTALAIR